MSGQALHRNREYNYEPLLTVAEKEIWRALQKRCMEQVAEDEALGVIRATPFGPKLKVVWSLNEAMKAA